MKFIIDENLSPDVATLFTEAGLIAYHVNQMKGHKKQRIRDDQLRRLSLNKDYIIVTKDDDFVKSYVSRKVPEKLVFVFGMENKSELLDQMKSAVSVLSGLLKEHDFLEISRKGIRTPFD